MIIHSGVFVSRAIVSRFVSRAKAILGRFSPSRLFLALNLSFILFIFLAGFRPRAWTEPPIPGDPAYYNGRRMMITARVCEEADVDYKSRRLTLCVPGSAGKLLTTTDLYPSYDYGDFLKLSGELEAPPAIEGFDYARYLARYDIGSVIYYPKIEKVRGRLTWPQLAFRALIRSKQKLKSLIDSNLPEPEAGLADALILGYRRTVDREDLDIFARVGLSHMIAISGSHITILSALILNFFLAFGLSRRFSLRFIFGFLIAYPLVTGLAASAVRSAVMGGLAFLAVYFGRTASLLKSLIFSAALMLAFNPRLLRDDVGFQLSFLALLGIIYIYPVGESWMEITIDRLSWRRTGKIIRLVADTANLTMVSQIVILPIALIDFNQLSLIAPLANILVLWSFAPLLVLLIFALAATAIIPAAGVLWFAPAYFLLKYIFVATDLLARPSWAAIGVTGFTWRAGALYYIALALAVFLGRRRSKQKTAIRR